MAAYKKSYKHIFIARNELSVIEEKLLASNNSNNMISLLQSDIANLDYLIGGQSTQPELVQQRIVNFTSNSEFDVDIINIEDVHKATSNGFEIITNQIELEGNYDQLVKFLYDCEINFEESRIVHANFYTKRNYRKNTKNLFLKIIFQNYEKAI